MKKNLGIVWGAIAGCLALTFVPYLILHDDDLDPTQVNEAQQRLDLLEKTARDVTAGRQALVATLESLVGRIERLEDRLDREPLPAAPAQPTTNMPRANPEPTPDASAKVSAREFKCLLGKVLRNSLDGTATEEEQQRFWQATRTTGLVDDTITSLETYVKTNPQDNEARMELGDAYVAKLLTVPGGPERGIWGMKAEKQWKDVVKRDPDHWDAQYTLAYNYSMYPDFLNKTDDAIAGFEQALRIQDRVASKPGHAKTYVQLARMHKKKGNAKKAREVLERGQMRHPRNDEIAKALRALQGG